MFVQTDQLQACDAVIQDFLDFAQVTNPPIDALQIAQKLDIQLLWDAAQHGRGRLLRQDGRETILLRPDERPERLQWAAAHELGEAVAWKVFQSAGLEFDEIRPQQREQLANVFAARFLLPSPWFERFADELDEDLMLLKQRFLTASHELVAWRLLDRSTPRIISIWDDGQLTRRRSNLPGRLPPVGPAERRFRDELLAQDQPQLDSQTAGRQRGWKLHESQVRREILLGDVPGFDGQTDGDDW